MRKWRCIKSNLSSKETAMVGDIFESDDKGMFKWRNGERASFPIYTYTKYEFEEIKEEPNLTRDEMIYKIDHEYCDGRLCQDCVFYANCRDYDEVSDEELIKDYNLAFNVKEEKERVEMNKFKVGDVVEILDGTDGAHGADGRIGTITNKPSNNGLSSYKEGINIDLGYRGIWKVGLNAKLKLISSSPQTFTITVSDTITTLKSADKTVSINRYHEDKHDVKLAIDYVVKKYFDEVEEEENKSREKYLANGNMVMYGEIGTPTILVDSVGRKLYIGDVVKVYEKDGKYLNTAIVCNDNEDGDFIMGFACVTKDNSKKYYNYIKEVSFENISNNNKIWENNIKIVDNNGKESK